MHNLNVFIKSFQDLDHATPIVSYLSDKTNVNIRLYSFTRDLPKCKEHLGFLRDEYGLTVRYLDDHIESPYKQIIRIYNNFLRRKSNIKNRKISLMVDIMSAKIISPFIGFVIERSIHSYLSSIKNEKILIDLGTEIGAYGRAFVKKSKFHNVKIIGYLHGYYVFSGSKNLRKDWARLNFIKKTASLLSKYKRKQLYCDCYLVGNKQKETWFSSSSMGNFDKEELNRVKEIGIPRYTREWIKIYRKKILPNKKFIYGDKESINVVFYMVHPKYNIKVESLLNMVGAINNIPNINFVYKPHTRNGLDGIDTTRMKGFDASNVSSVLLSEWADIGIDIGSSITIQLLIDNVPVIVPTFICNNSTIFQEMGVCSEVASIKGLISAIENTKNNKVDKDKRIDKFISEIVYGNRDYNDLLDCFYESIIQC